MPFLILTVRVSKLHCTGSQCRVYGDVDAWESVDYVYAYAPAHVRYSDGVLTVDFGTEVECQKFYSEEYGIWYLLCAPVVTDHDIVEDEFGLPAVVRLEEVE